MEKTIKLWFDAEADYLEVTLSDAPGLMTATDDDAVMKRVDAEGKLLGFAIMNVSRLAKEHRPLAAKLVGEFAA